MGMQDYRHAVIIGDASSREVNRFLQLSQNGVSLFVEASWALNVQDFRECCVILCGTEAGADTIQDPNGGYDI